MITRGMYNLDLLSRGMYGREAVVVVGRFTLYRHAVEAVSSGYSLVVDVTAAADADREIFVHHLSPRTEDQPRQVVFSHIASPTDLEEYPIGIPASGTPFYHRRSSVSLVFRNLLLLHESWLAIGKDVQSLAESLDQLDVTEEATRQLV